MKIALINNAAGNTGIGKYAFELHKSLISATVDVDHYISNRSTRYLEKISSVGNIKIHKVEKNLLIDNTLLMRMERLPNLILDYKTIKYVPKGYDVVHVTNQTICNVGYFKNLSNNIVTVHDLIFYVYPKNYLIKIFSNLLYKGLNKYNYFISDSEATKRDLIRYLGVSEKSIHVIHLGVNEIFRQLPSFERDRIYAKYGLDRSCRYLLHVGAPEPRKNVVTLLKAFHKLITELRVKDIKLIKVNQLSLNDEKLVNELNLRDYIKVIESVSQEDLVTLYNIADVFIFPSLYEGFGFPPLEAMACGTPVIASNVSSIPEVVGNAGILIEPTDIGGFARGIYQVLGDSKLKESMKLNGLNRAKEFNWEKTAKETMEIYRKVC